jgi:hypothetical protein
VGGRRRWAATASDVVKGDLDDEATPRRALTGAWGVFGVQNTREVGLEEVLAKAIAQITLARQSESASK